MKMSPTVCHLAQFRSYSEHNMQLEFFDEKTREIAYVHRTSWHPTVPGLLPLQNEPCILVFNCDGQLVMGKPCLATELGALTELMPEVPKKGSPESLVIAARKFKVLRDSRIARCRALQEAASAARRGGPSGRDVIDRVEKDFPIVSDVSDLIDELCAALEVYDGCSPVRLQAHCHW